jgi:predicted RND superfamily exporter protein
VERLVRLVVGWPRSVLAATGALLAVSALFIARLRLDTDFAALLPRRAPAVVALEELKRRVSARSSLDVVVQGPDGAANRRFVDALVARLRALAEPAIEDVRPGVHEEQAFFEHNRFLFAGRADLEQARDWLRRRIARAKNPLLVDLDDDPASPRALPESPFARFPDGYFALSDRSVYGVVIWLRASVLDDRTNAAVVAHVRATAQALARELPSPGQRVGLTGTLVTAGEERAALTHDLTMATAISIALVCTVVLLYFGRARALPFMVLPALVGVAVALAFAQICFGSLNTATGFLGAIIVGNGINYAIVQMARYEEERRRGSPVVASLRVALESTWRATGLAALGAAAAYGSLVVTDFRGFAQFGWIGGMGMLLAWLATLLVLPALWVLFDRSKRRPSRARLVGRDAAAPLARLVTAHPRTVLAVGLGLSLAALAALPRWLGDPFEYDFDKLRNQVSKHSDSEVLATRLNPVFGRSLSPGFVLAESPSQIEPIRAEMLARDRTRHVLGSVRTVADFLPGSPEEQTQKLATLGEIRRMIDQNLSLVDGDARRRLAELRPPDDLHVIAARDLPPSVLRFYTESDGTVGRIAVWLPREDLNVWDGRVLRRLAEVVGDLRLADGTHIRSSGQAVIFSAIIDAVSHDGPIVTAVSFFAVLGLVLLLARRDRRSAALILGSLCVGVLWMVGAVAAARVRINFLNFIALPITFGIAADYSANLCLRCRLEGPGGVAVERSVRSTGGAVALCSLTTMIGYGSLLASDTAGLRTFGAAAILGELGCITTALFLVPAALTLLDRSAR